MIEYKTNFLIITALEEERDSILEKLPEVRELPPLPNDIRTYYSSNLPVTFADNSTGTYRIIVTLLLGMGRVQAANATGDAIRLWQPDYVMLVGIAGGFANADVKLGDVLVSDQIVDYELQKITLDGPQVRYEVHRADPRLLGASQNLRGNGWLEEITIKRPVDGTPKRHIGPILSGDKSVAVSEVLKKYAGEWPKLKGVEMEAGGVASASFQAAQKPGFFMIRGVSDLADENETTDEVQKWRSYACDVAASYTIALIKSGRVPLAQQQDFPVKKMPRENNGANKKVDQSEIRTLIKLLQISELVTPTTRRGLCQEIGIERPGQLTFINVESDDSFATQLINHLNNIGKRTSLNQLCEKLEYVFTEGDNVEKLASIKEKLK